MRAKEFILEKKKRKSRKHRWAAYGPGPYGWYGYDASYSGDSGSGIEENWKNTLANIGIAGAISAGGSAGLLGKQALDNYLNTKSDTATVQTPVSKKTTPPIDTKILKVTPKAKEPVNIETKLENSHEKLLAKHAQAAGITGIELAAFLAQCAHETHDFNSLEEYGNAKYFRKYDIRFNKEKAKILGNVKAGDGARYKGRGYIQLTGRYNYMMAGKALGLDLEKNPELLEDPETAAKVSIWYWKNRVQPNVSNFENVAAVTKQINPGLRGLADRKQNFKDYKQLILDI